MAQVFKRLASICNKGLCEVLCENIFWKTSSNLRENIFDEVFLSKIVGLFACKFNIKDSITGIFLSICEILRNSRTVFSAV